MRSIVLAALLFGACSPNSEPAPASRVDEPAAQTASPGVDGTTGGPSKSPSFLDLTIDPEQRFPIRAKVRRAGSVYESRDPGAADPLKFFKAGHGLWRVIVLDDDAGGKPRRPRLLCSERSHRVAIHRDAIDLASVALRGALISADQTAPAAITETTPGVRLEPGAIVVPTLQPTQGRQRVTYKSLFIEAKGWMDTNRIDIIYRPQPLDDDDIRDGELMQNVSLLDAPNGKSLAEIAKAPDISNRLFIKKLGPPQAGQVLIRYSSGDAQAVGWVPEGAVKSLPRKKLTGGGGGGSGNWRGTGPHIDLPKGTLLRSDTSNEALGIVTQDDAFRCSADCDSKTPLVEVGTCVGNIHLRAAR